MEKKEEKRREIDREKMVGRNEKNVANVEIRDQRERPKNRKNGSNIPKIQKPRVFKACSAKLYRRCTVKPSNGH